MVLIIDFNKKQMMGTALVKDIRQLGLVRASAKARGRPINNPEDITRWSQLFADEKPEPDNDWKPDTNEDEEW